MMTLTGGGAAADGGSAMKAALRHAILQQEVVFRNQVRELHRLYWTQKNLMREMCRAAGDAAPASAPACSQTARKKWPVETGVCDGGVRQEKQREMMLDLQLPADEYIRGGGVLVSTGSETGTIDFSSLNGGLKDSAFTPSIDLSTQKPISTAGKRLHIDLNLDQEDESFDHLNNSTITFPSPAASSSVQCTFLWREPSNIHSKESMTCQSDLVNPSSSISGGKVAADFLLHASQDLHHAQVCQSDPKGPEKEFIITTEDFYSSSDGQVQTSLNKVIPLPEGLPELGEQNAYSSSGRPHSNVHTDGRTQALAVTFNNGFDCNNNRHTSVGSTNPLATVTTESDDKQANCDGSEEDTVSSHALPRDKDQGSGLEELSVLKKPVQANGNSDRKDSETKQLNLITKDFPFSPTCNQACKGELEPLVPLAEATEIDCMTVAAEVLASFSFETLEKIASPEKLVSVGQRESDDDQPDKPQYSSDSYESITLNLSETRDDRFKMPVASTEETIENNLCSVKLRRGRRMRDFQKDVLPGLVSLSRHEIREDLQIIGYEHRRNKSRQQSPSWLVPVRRRRSARKSAGQRC